MPKTVLLTGASGFIAKHICQQLLAGGHSVVASVRSQAREAEVRAIAPEGSNDRLRFVHLDLTRDDGWTEAATGVDAILHTASPFPMVQPKNKDDLIRPAVDGTLRALRAAKAAGVERVILTSSVVSIYGKPVKPGEADFDESDWTDTDDPSQTAYALSKTLAERAAWDFVATEAPEMKLTTINPGLVIGPPLDSTYGTSLQLVERILGGKDPMLPNVGFVVVDVRDVAAMHVKALEDPTTAGERFAAASDWVWMPGAAKILKALYPDRKIATKTAPALMLRLIALFDPSLQTILPDLGKKRNVSGAKARERMGIAFIPMKDSFRASAEAILR